MNITSPPDKIYLIGMMGAGKTSVGKLLAAKLNYGFLDTDDYIIENSAQKTIAEIFDTAGETKFRQLESQALMQLSTEERSVIATGGGIVEKSENWDHLDRGFTIWLDADLDLLKQRLAGDRSRPLASQLESLFPTRRPLYEQRAKLSISIKPEQTPEDIVTEIINNSHE